MSLKEVVLPYEYLIRIHQDGTVGAHRQDLNQITRDGEVIQTTLGTQTELTLAELKAYVASLTEQDWYAPIK